MNKKYIKNITDLKDSYILYEEDLPCFGYIIITVVMLLFVSILIWSIKTSKTYVVKSQGIVESINKNYIMSMYTGKIKEINVSEGSFVKEGDLLLTIKSTDLDLQKDQIAGQIEVYEKNINQLRKLEKSVIDKNNYFDIDNDEDRQYYNQYEVYINQIKQNEIDVYVYKNYGYTDEQIKSEIKKNDTKVSEIYYSTLKTINENINQYENEISKLKIQNEVISNGQSEYNILASTSGVVHLLNDYKEGMVVQATNAIGSIASENDQYIITAYLGTNDRPRVSVNDDVDIEVIGLSQSVYGNLKGKVQSIDNDVSTSQDGKQNFFKSKIIIDKPYLISGEGNKVNILNGMAVEVRIVYNKISYFNYFLESVGISSK